MENVSVIVASFGWGVNTMQAINDIKTQLATVVPLLPSDAMEPVVTNADPRMLPVMKIGVTGLDDVAALTKVAEDHLVTPDRTTSGSSQGKYRCRRASRDLRLFDTEALRANNTSAVMLYELIRQQNTLIPAGVLEDNSVRYHVRVGNPLTSVEDIRDLVIGEKKNGRA